MFSFTKEDFFLCFCQMTGSRMIRNLLNSMPKLEIRWATHMKQTPGCCVFKPVRTDFFPFHSCFCIAAFGFPILGVEWFTQAPTHGEPWTPPSVPSTAGGWPGSISCAGMSLGLTYTPYISAAQRLGMLLWCHLLPDLGLYTLYYLVSSLGLSWWFNKHFVQLFKNTRPQW